MDRQDNTKPQENAEQPAELSDQDLEQIAGGIKSPDPAAQTRLEFEETGFYFNPKELSIDKVK